MRISDWSSDVCSSDLVGRKPIKLVLRPIFQALGPVSEHRRAVRHDRYQEVRREGLDGVPLQPDDWIRAANSAKPNDAIQERLRLQGLYLCRYLSKSQTPAFRKIGRASGREKMG